MRNKRHGINARNRKLSRILGFSLMELIVVIAILAVFTVMLTPSLVSYVELSRAQKDESSLNEVSNAVVIGLTDLDALDEMYEQSEYNNYSCYIDQPSEEGLKQIITSKPSASYKQYTFGDETRKANRTVYYLAGNMYGLTITFQPEGDKDSRIYDIGEGIVNKYINNEKVVKLSDCPALYNSIRMTVGNTISLTSQTYKNSEYTIFIRMSVADNDSLLAQDAVVVYGQYGGSNLGKGDHVYKPVEEGREVDETVGGNDNCEHDIEIVAGRPATCVDEGLTIGRYCKICGEVFQKQGKIPATGKHNWEISEDGTERTCAVCGKTESIGSVHTHSFVKVSEPDVCRRCSCGEEDRSHNMVNGACTKCDYTTIVSCAHENTHNVAETAATCKTPGFTAGVFCDDCNTYISGHSETPINANNHVQFTKVSDKNLCRTCVCGYKDTEHNIVNGGCADCDYTTTVVCAHTNVSNIDATESTCKTKGYSAGEFCNDCNEYISGHEELPLNNNNHEQLTPVGDPNLCRTCICGYEDAEHNIVNGECTDCGYTTIVSCSHNNTSNVSATAATCVSEGYTAGVFCDDCDQYISGHETIPIDEDNHSSGYSSSVAAAATCHTNGTTRYTCKNGCGYSYTSRDISSTSYWITVSTTPGTCVADKTQIVKCAACGVTQTWTYSNTSDPDNHVGPYTYPGARDLIDVDVTDDSCFGEQHVKKCGACDREVDEDCSFGTKDLMFAWNAVFSGDSQDHSILHSFYICEYCNNLKKYQTRTDVQTSTSASTCVTKGSFYHYVEQASDNTTFQCDGHELEIDPNNHESLTGPEAYTDTQHRYKCEACEEYVYEGCDFNYRNIRVAVWANDCSSVDIYLPCRKCDNTQFIHTRDDISVSETDVNGYYYHYTNDMYGEVQCDGHKEGEVHVHTLDVYVDWTAGCSLALVYHTCQCGYKELVAEFYSDEIEIRTMSEATCVDTGYYYHYVEDSTLFVHGTSSCTGHTLEIDNTNHVNYHHENYGPETCMFICDDCGTTGASGHKFSLISGYQICEQCGYDKSHTHTLTLSSSKFFAGCTVVELTLSCECGYEEVQNKSTGIYQTAQIAGTCNKEGSYQHAYDVSDISPYIGHIQCGVKHTTDIDPNNHQNDYYKSYGSTTCMHVCDDCGMNQPGNHNMQIVNGTYQCANGCGYGSAHTHEYESTVTKDATCMAVGTRKYTCSIFGDTYTEDIPKAAHQYGEIGIGEYNTTQHKVYCTNDGCTESKWIDHFFKAGKCACGYTENGFAPTPSNQTVALPMPSYADDQQFYTQSKRKCDEA